MEQKDLITNPRFEEYFKKSSYYGKGAKSVPLFKNTISSTMGMSSTSLDDIKTQDVADWIKSPNKYYGKLVDLSKTLYKQSGEYRSILNYFIDMARFYYVLDPIYPSVDKLNEKKIKRELSLLSGKFEKMNLSHELHKVFKTCVMEDVFFGYEIEDEDDYFLLKLDPDYCRINSVIDGSFGFEFNLSYFDGREELLASYPPEFKTAYNRSKLDKRAYGWMELDFLKSVCFKFNDGDPEIFPPFAAMFEPILDLNDYKKLKKAGAKINNYMLLHQKVPMHDNAQKDYAEDNFAISPDAMNYFNSMVNESLPDEIGAIVSPMDINPISLDKDSKNDKVQEATRDMYNSSGVSSFLFNNDKNSTGGLDYSVQKDEMLVMSFYRQVERWLNRKIKHGGIIPKATWKVSLLNATGFNEDKLLESLTKSGTFGFAVRGRIAALHGLNYHTLMLSLELENEILDLDTKLIPLASSHTGGLNVAAEQVKGKMQDSGGRPAKEKKDLSDSGQANRDSSTGKAIKANKSTAKSAPAKTKAKPSTSKGGEK